VNDFEKAEQAANQDGWFVKADEVAEKDKQYDDELDLSGPLTPE